MAAIDIPEDVYEALRIPDDERDDVVRTELAVSLYARGALSFGKARELAGLSNREFHALLGDRRIERHYTAEEFDEDRQYAKE